MVWRRPKTLWDLPSRTCGILLAGKKQNEMYKAQRPCAGSLLTVLCTGHMSFESHWNWSEPTTMEKKNERIADRHQNDIGACVFRKKLCALSVYIVKKNNLLFPSLYQTASKCGPIGQQMLVRSVCPTWLCPRTTWHMIAQHCAQGTLVCS